MQQIISTREFYANQDKFLTAAMSGQSVLLTSPYGNFRIVPVEEDDDSLTARICRGLEQVKMIQDGKLPKLTIQDMFDDL